MNALAAALQLTQIGGLYHYLLAIEISLTLLILLSALFFFLSAQHQIKPLKAPLVEKVCVSSLIGLSLIFSLFWWSHFFSPGKTLLTVSLAMPGSLPTQVLLMEVESWLRRALEPSLWLLFLAIFLLFLSSRNTAGSLQYLISALCCVFLLVLETILLFPAAWSLEQHVPRYLLLILHAVLTQCIILGLCSGLLRQLLLHRDTRLNLTLSFKQLSVAVLLFFALPASLSISTKYFISRAKPSLPVIGAHYYTWFPENWKAGTLGQKTAPTIAPLLGYYDSDNPAIFRQHARWARAAKIDFFIFDWWPSNVEARGRLYSIIKDPSLFEGLRYCIQYEALDLKQQNDVPVPGETPDTIVMTEERIRRMQKHMERIVRFYGSQAEYLHINDKPVVYLYATRHLVGNMDEVIRRVRRHVKEKTGKELFLIGDEVYYHVMAFSKQKGVYLLPKFVPNWGRLTTFDAITAYNPYDPNALAHAGPAGPEQFLKDTAELYRRYRAIAATATIAFMPTVIPGFNDRGVRPAEAHYVLPRRLGDSPAQESLFSASLSRLAFPFVDTRLPFINITSWNEWNEWTQIEPTTSTAPTTADISASGSDYTQGIPHYGYYHRYLAELAAHVQIQRSRQLD